MYKDLTPSEKFVFEWQYRMAGGFGTMLAHLFCKADAGNFNRLALAFPAEAEGMNAYLHEAGWWTEVERKGWEGKASEQEIADRRHSPVQEVPPEWAKEYAQTMARQAFGYFMAEQYPKDVMPTEAINKSIDAVMSKSYLEWHN